jgi:hypothetical protein
VSVRTLRNVKLIGVIVLVALVATTAAFAGRGDPRERFNPADQARAKAMLLRPADFSVAYTARPGSSGGGDFYCAALDESDLTLTGKARSPSYTTTGEYVSSSSDVYASRSDATASWKRGTSSAGQQCLRAGLRAELQGTAVKLVSLKRLPFPRRGERSAAYRAVAIAQGIRVYLDVVAMQVSRAEASVLYVAALGPPPAGELPRLTGVVERRMEKAMRGAS